MNITLTSTYEGFDVCVNTGYLMEIFSSIQQEGRSIAFNLDQQGFSMVAYTGEPNWWEWGANLTLGDEILVVTANGGLHYCKRDNHVWFECMIAPPA